MSCDYSWLDAMGLCHKCGYRKKFPGRQFCPECLEKIAEINAKKYDPAKAHEYQTRRREIYREKKEAGICIRCKKPATHGMYCYSHYIVAKRRSQEQAKESRNKRHDRGLVPDQRARESRCLWCGEPASGGTNACDYHRKLFSDAGKRGKKTWDELNKLIFVKEK